MLTGLCLIGGNYYTFDPQYATEAEARASITEHMRDNMRKILSEEKTRADKKIQKDGVDYVNHGPSYFKPKVLEKFCKYWKSDDFQRKSAFAKAARGRVRTPHTSGSYTFERRRRDYKRKHGEEQDIIEYFKDTHTLRKKKQSDQISKAAIDAIIKRYLEICADKGIDSKKTQIQSWIYAVGAKKNKILGFPKLCMSDVIGILRS
ncbi:hypothetical protein POM88_028718 [Heracleum sosnowskyi]|uniref:Uncharacterized protein n=1 Tax=Heracleum sosnowskyi TaxID=360622 RepID=A0AAD8ME99_9APIA|nr:hypothetical protein POM88_028718 [Heracleum sosnowskyi]